MASVKKYMNCWMRSWMPAQRVKNIFFFWIGNADSRSPAYISSDDGKEKMLSFLSFSEEDLIEAKKVIENGHDAAKREFWVIQGTGH